ncbi:hypothetical protein ACFCZ1_25895 [Streptomyces sp. NPDC056224]|uniref:hypothetical protein n=1 Tax=Streptomyces sp. NPDC056224 TaxID=3345750 RepID=UPI0035DCB73D
MVAWAHARKLSRERLSIQPGYQFGYLFLAELAEIIGARFTPRPSGSASQLVVADSWPTRGTFQAEEHPVELDESAWVEVRSVTLRAPSTKPSTLYDFGLTPHPDFLVNGHLVRTPWET